jgi:imidazolonepropionase-like amidohydrolase
MEFAGRIFNGEKLLEHGLVSINEETGLIDYLDETRNAKNKGLNHINEDITFLPGFIDTHIHFFGTQERSLNKWVLTPDVQLTIKSLNDANKLLLGGFTTVRTLGDKVSLEMSKAEKRGLFIGPRIISAGKSLAETGGNDDPKDFPLDFSNRVSYSYYCDGPWECRKAVRKNLRDGAETIKSYSSSSFVGGGKIKSEFTVEELKAISDETHNAGLKCASHAYGEGAIENSIEGGFDSIEHGLGLNEDLAERIKKKGMFYVPTMSVYSVKRDDHNPIRESMIKKHLEKEVKLAYETGIQIACGTDYVGSFDEPHGQNFNEIVLLSNILGNENALRSATTVASKCIGIDNVGAIKKGNIADLIAVRGNPLEDINSIRPENIVLVMRKGQIVVNKMN